MAEFLDMGGYAAYVWPSYAVFVLVLALEALAPRFQRRRVLAELRARLKRREARTGSPTT
ncbi:MAG: heme exporter protein CcmD [Lysobacteraceae bacterium]|nr:MAG: heme exporter protein CcmD [Xanthomonadaceae bacterium]